MSDLTPGNRLDRPVDDKFDHILGPPNAAVTLVEYGSYACPYCRAANERIAEVRDQFGDRMRYVFRHRPLVGVELARRAAELVERALGPRRFWDEHVKLMTRSEVLTEDDLIAVARVGPWDESALADAMLGTLGHRVRSAALDFASWGPSAGVLLLLATALAVALTNSSLGPGFAAFWEQKFGFTFDGAGFSLSLLHWINDGLLTLFFLVVGLEIKREFTVGHLAGWRSAALPVAGAIGGMVAPAALYLLVVPPGPWSHGWGVPMSTDTAFVVALIVMLGPRVPVELRIFLTAAAIVDDLGAIAAVALFYSGDPRLSGARGCAGRRAGDAQPLARLCACALCRRRRRLVGVRAGERPASDPGRRHPGAVHSDPPAAEPDRAHHAGGRHHRRRGGGRGRSAATRTVRAGPARSMRSTTGSSRRPIASCATPARARATSCCRCSPSPTPASR